MFGGGLSLVLSIIGGLWYKYAKKTAPENEMPGRYAFAQAVEPSRGGEEGLMPINSKEAP